jgi:L-lactate dehydrogenase complex protein LldF
MNPSSQTFKSNIKLALHDEQLQAALTNVGRGFVEKRRVAVEALPEFDSIRVAGRTIKEHTLEHLGFYLEQFEQRVVEAGGQVHWARDAAEACRIVTKICQDAGARLVTKGKSMVGEEIGINEALDEAGLERIETDLGEYIVQLADEPPSHIIAPAIHKTRGQIADLFEHTHTHLQRDKHLEEVPEIVNEARQILREKFLSADVGITGANFLIAESGSAVIVTNEGNGDLTATLPKTHIVTTGIDKIVPTLEDATTLLRLLSRSATGQDFTAYTTFFTGPKRDQDLDGPEAYHVVLIDNGRSEMLGNEFREMLRCIRCGACLNHCPVYGAIGGHAYGWVYPGPMGSVLTPLMIGLKTAGDLPNASTLCGRCEEVCPMSIPLPRLLRQHRIRQFEQGLVAPRASLPLKLWAQLARRPGLYRLAMRIGMRTLGLLGRRRGRFRSLPLAGGWTRSRDLPAPQGPTFIARWQAGRHEP